MTIRTEDINEMVEIAAGLTRAGIGFNSYKKQGTWIIELTGSY